MQEKHAKFKAYWESIGKPKLEIFDIEDDPQWGLVSADIPNFCGDNYRIKGDPHWELRREWVDSDFTLPIEGFHAIERTWIPCPNPAWLKEHKYRKAQQTGDKTMPEFKIGDKVKIVKKVTTNPQKEMFIWNNAMDATIGTTESISDVGSKSAIKLKNG